MRRRAAPRRARGRRGARARRRAERARARRAACGRSRAARGAWETRVAAERRAMAGDVERARRRRAAGAAGGAGARAARSRRARRTRRWSRRTARAGTTACARSAEAQGRRGGGGGVPSRAMRRWRARTALRLAGGGVRVPRRQRAGGASPGRAGVGGRACRRPPCCASAGAGRVRPRRRSTRGCRGSPSCSTTRAWPRRASGGRRTTRRAPHGRSTRRARRSTLDATQRLRLGLRVRPAAPRRRRGDRGVARVRAGPRRRRRRAARRARSRRTPRCATREALLRARRAHDDAIRACGAVGDDFAARDEAKLALADAFVMKGDRAWAVPIWRALLAACAARRPLGGHRRCSSRTRCSTAWTARPRRARQEALDLTTRVLVEAPMTAEKARRHRTAARAAARQSSCRGDAGSHARGARPPGAGLARRGAAEARDRDGARRCSRRCRVQGQEAPRGGVQGRHRARPGLPHGKSDDAADAWGEAIARCDGQDAQVTALYYGGKASASAHRDAEAIARFELVEKQFPQHRLADDARFHAALVVFDQGDEAKYVAMLGGIPDAYPDGDMRGEALFRVALARLAKRDLDGAREALDRILGLRAGRPRLGLGAGRAAYFRARVAQLAGDVDDAKAPLRRRRRRRSRSRFYMLLAYARLRAIDDAARARRRAGRRRARAGRDRSSPREHDGARDARVRAVRAPARGGRDGRRAARGVAPAASWPTASTPRCCWTVAWLYDRAGAPDLGHSFARGAARRLSRPLARGALAPRLAGRLPAAVGRRRRRRERVGRHPARAHVGHHARGVRVQPGRATARRTRSA